MRKGSIQRYGTRTIRLIIPSVLFPLMGARSATAQTRFEWPIATPNLAHYADSYECLAVAWRVRDSVARRAAFDPDTMPWTPTFAVQPLPAAVKEVAQRCEAHVPLPQQPLSDFAARLQVYLFAGRDSAAAALIAQRLKALSPDASERAAVLDTVIPMYLDKPARLASAESYLRDLERIERVVPLRSRIINHYLFMKSAQEAGDTTRARWSAEHIVSINATLNSAQRLRLSQDESNLVGPVTYSALTFLHQNELLDSLRRNRTSYIAVQRANWALATGERAEALHLPLGEIAPPLEGEFWFGRGDRSVSRPTRGKVAVVVSTMPGPDCSLGCAQVYAVLRRLGRRFPELEITLVAKTAGFVSLHAFSPADEAEQMRRWWLDEQKISAALVVSMTDFWRLPAPDLRRINRDTPNEIHYEFGPWKGRSESSFIIDRSGRVISVVPAAPENEEYLGKVVEILLEQHTASR
jgi:hypothetical protein